eukprot:scaffold66878_cov30-Tisochrysis_lutea.AAC.4
MFANCTEQGPPPPPPKPSLSYRCSEQSGPLPLSLIPVIYYSPPTSPPPLANPGECPSLAYHSLKLSTACYDKDLHPQVGMAR